MLMNQVQYSILSCFQVGVQPNSCYFVGHLKLKESSSTDHSWQVQSLNFSLRRVYLFHCEQFSYLCIQFLYFSKLPADDVETVYHN